MRVNLAPLINRASTTVLGSTSAHHTDRLESCLIDAVAGHAAAAAVVVVVVLLLPGPRRWCRATGPTSPSAYGQRDSVSLRPLRR